MRYSPCLLYSQSFTDLAMRFEDSIARGCSAYSSSQPIALFFRADDIGVPSHLFQELITLFRRHHLPLCLAVVPSWLTPRRYTELREITGHDDSLWCWHQHGRLHRNFEPSGKNQEFGPARSQAIIYAQLRKGQQRLQSILAEAFSPFFTPPWNRCSRETALALQALHFTALSRSSGAKPDVSDIMPDIQVNVDLHTRKETDPEASLTKLLEELENALASGKCGIMIHHQRMNRHAFLFLDLLMQQLMKRAEILPRSFSQLV